MSPTALGYNYGKALQNSIIVMSYSSTGVLDTYGKSMLVFVLTSWKADCNAVVMS